MKAEIVASAGTRPEAATAVVNGPRRVGSPALFGSAREIVILHRGHEYRLRITKADKLILTK